MRLAAASGPDSYRSIEVDLEIVMSMRKSFVFTLMAGLVGLLSAASQPVLGASGTCTGASCTTPNVDLNFQVVIPRLVRLRIGDPVAVNTLVFDMTATPGLVGDSSPVTGTGGDLLGISRVTVNVLANGGATSVQVDTSVTGGGSGIDCQAASGSCQNGTDFIAWDQITVAGNGCSVAPPILDNAGSGFANYNAVGGIINENCAWDYTYDNDTVPVDGTYTGTVTYTATVTP
jgi:hypothetical protein